MLSKIYNQDFFEGINPDALRSAEVIVPILIELFHPDSVVDVGCGTGVWLSVFKKFGVSKVKGIDGAYVEPRSLLIDKNEFTPADLRKPVSLSEKFDLALCLEVAEHIPPNSARGLVDSLTKLSPIIFFSAAVPGQTGKRHINEQWPSYWENLFVQADFVAIDPVRPLIWQNSGVAWFYRQNCFLYVRRTLIESNEILHRYSEIHTHDDLLLIHKYVLKNNLSVLSSLKRIPVLTASAISRGFRKILHQR